MLDQPIFRISDDLATVRRLVVDHPWATLVSQAEHLVVSHLPILCELTGVDEELSVVGHLARSDGEAHMLGEQDVVLVVQGPNGYLTPSWYRETPHVPTWNFVVVHLFGRPEVLDDDETFQILSDTVDRFEGKLPVPWRLTEVDEYAHNLAPHTMGFRLRPTQVVAKAKLSQDESLELRTNAITGLRANGPFRNLDLAAAMTQALPAAQREGPAG
jgi:transcriptional regulator